MKAQHRDDKKLSRQERRNFLKLLLGLAAVTASPLFPPGRALSFPGTKMKPDREWPSEFAFAQLQYRGGNWDPEPSAWPSLQRELESTTSIEARGARVTLQLRSPELFSYPFLFMSGNDNFDQFHDDEINILRKYLKSGGLLFADDCGGIPGYGFDASFRREAAKIFPGASLQRLPSDHTVFKSFFLVRGMGGRRVVSPFMEGISLGRRTPVIYSPNALSSAWAKDSYGRWLHEAEPGGERQRKLAFHLGINVILYALCDDYKQDRIHLPFLRQKI